VGLRCLKHALGRSGIKPHGLFAKDVAAALGGLNRGLLVEIGRKADDDGVKAVVTKELREAGVNLQAWKRIANLFRLKSGHRQHLNARNFSGCLQMDPSDVPHAGNSQIEHVLSTLVRRCWFEIQAVLVNSLDSVNDIIHVLALGQ